MNEVTVVAKAGMNVAKHLCTAADPTRFPNAHEALLELYAILYEWCERAEQSSRYARAKLGPAAEQTYVPGESYGGGATNVGGGQSGGYVRRAYADFHGVLGNKAPLGKRWLPAERRRAARRSLRTILVAYCPQLLDEFESAVQTRFDWVRQHEKHFDRWLEQHHSHRDVDRMLNEMDRTNRRLISATERLREFITTAFPLPDSA